MRTQTGASPQNSGKTAESNYDNLILRLQLALKDNEQRVLPPGFAPQNAPETEARLAALEAKVEEILKQMEELKKQSVR